MIESIIEEIVRFDASETTNIYRNIHILCSYFGLRQNPNPTYQSVANDYDAGSRQNIEQLIKRIFRNKLASVDISLIKESIAKLDEFEMLSDSDLQDLMRSTGLINAESWIHLHGLQNLIECVTGDLKFKIIDIYGKVASKSDIECGQKLYLAKPEIQAKISEAIKNIRSLPGKLGMANFTCINAIANQFDAREKLYIHEMILAQRDIFVSSFEGSDWYLFEDRSNKIINSIERAFSCFDRINAIKLAETIENILHDKKSEHAYPPMEVISDYITKSRYTAYDEGMVRLLGECPTRLKIDSDLFTILENGPRDSVFIVENLQTFGHEEAYSRKILRVSPIIYKKASSDSNNRTRYKFELLFKAESDVEMDFEILKYIDIKKNLGNLLENGTDESVESKFRKEQHLLRRWVFGDKEQETCAICGHVYDVKSMVCAHKKKRSQCSDFERIDPYIVMPACLLGCDHIYESRFIEIHNGIIIRGRKEPKSNRLNEIIVDLIGNAIPARWLKGSSEYFN